MEGEHDVFANARIIDLRDSTVIDLNVEDRVSIGLTVEDQVVSGDSSTEAVISLCHVERRRDGHWLIPDPYLPCLLNDEDVSQAVLLSQGSTIKSGDRFLRYTYFQTKKRRVLPRTPGSPFPPAVSPSVRSQAVTPQSAAPPPKPKRSWVYTGSFENIDLIGGEDNTDGTNEEVDTGQEPTQPELESFTQSVDEELLKHVQSPVEIANMAASYVCRQVMMYTDTVLSSGQLDHLFKALQFAASYAERVISTFISEYTQTQRAEEGNFSSSSTHSLLPTEARPIHGPVIHLLIELLKLSLDPEEHVELWMQLLCTFSHFSQNQSDLLQYQGAPIVMGVMAAFRESAEIQQYACSILSQLALHQPGIGEKGPVRESAVELTVRAMKLHPTEARILRAACRTLANITTTYSSLTEQLLDPEMEEQEELSDLIVNWLNILDFIQSESLATVLDTMERYPHDLGIQTEGRRILFFYFDPDLENGKVSEGDLLSSAKHSIGGTSDREYESSLESSITTVSSWYEASTAVSDAGLKSSMDSLEVSSLSESITDMTNRGLTRSCDVQPDLISEVRVSSSPPPDLVSSQEISPFLRVGDKLKEVTDTESLPKKPGKKKRTTHKDIKSKVKAMINKGKLKISDSVGKKKRKSLTVEETNGNFRKMAREDDNADTLTEDISDMKKNLTALLTDGSDEIIEVVQNSEKNPDNPDGVSPHQGVESGTCSNAPEIIISESENIQPEDAERGGLNVLLGSNENLHQLQRRYSTRKQWKKAEKPDIHNLTSEETLSLADSLEGATYLSGVSCSDYVDGEEDLDPELIEEIRINKMKWKHVVAQIKDQCSSNEPLARNSPRPKHGIKFIVSSPDIPANDTLGFASQSGIEESLEESSLETPPPNSQVAKAMEVEIETSRVPISPKPQRRNATDTDDIGKSIVEDDSDPSPDNSKGSDDYLVIATPEKENESTAGCDQEEDDTGELLVIGQENVRTEENMMKSKTSKSFSLSPLISKAKSLSPFSKRKSKSKSGGQKTNKKEESIVDDDENDKDNLLDRNSNLAADGNGRNTKDLASELADAAGYDPVEGTPETKKLKQPKKKSPKGTKTAANISKDHDSMMQILASRTLILNHIMITWKEDRPKALGLLQAPLYQILEDANAPQDITSILEKQQIDKLILRDADPALAMNLLQVLCDSPFGLQIALKLAESTSELLSDRQRPYHVHLATTCLLTLLQGPLASPDPQGNDTATLKDIHKKVTALLKFKDNMEQIIFTSLSSLQISLQERLLCKPYPSTLVKDYV